MTDVRVPVDIPDHAFWKFAELAEKRGLRADQFLSLIAQGFVEKEPPQTHLSLRDRWAAGWTDKEIAADLVMTNQAVSAKRRSLGLPANKQRKTA